MNTLILLHNSFFYFSVGKNEKALNTPFCQFLMGDKKMEMKIDRAKEIASEIIEETKRRVLEELFGKDAISIAKSENPWNAYVEYKDGRRQFVTGGYWSYVSSIMRTLEALRVIAIREFEKYNNIEVMIERAWKEKTQQ